MATAAPRAGPLSVALLVDVDGVIAPYDLPGAERTGWPASSWRTAPVLFGMEITWSGAMVERLARIAALPGVEPAWCTTWGFRAARYLGPAIGLGEDWPCLEGEGGGAFAVEGWWKADRAREALATHAGVIWIDDLIDGWRDELAATGQPAPESWPGGRLLTVSPRPDRGLEPAHLDEAELFLSTVLPGSVAP
ncbi:hypothetical protein [Demequina lignilytica]|uniref:Secreted protein n=1 Tax=Demequina lignilytica TaxID=3051663 RepID=A0AB35MJR4_9MICO|nr:hypothetical protein [Demequina sp. SYSU T0a273]MDN4483918.1 hypothetical protein [Demequina sp. SYSU T0a273]